MQVWVHYIDESEGFQLLLTAWNILKQTSFQFAPFGIVLSMADIFLGSMYMLLAGYVLRKIFWW